jgi:hypothetical protein
VVTDGLGSDVTSTLNITVTAEDDTFTDASETVSVKEDSTGNTGNLLSGTSSVDGPVSIKSASVGTTSIELGKATDISSNGKVIGSLTINTDGSYAFTPAQNYFGAVPTITYVVTDGLGGDVTSTLNITVTAEDDTFTDASETVSVKEDSTGNTGNLLTGTSSVDGPVSIKSASVGTTSIELGKATDISSNGKVIGSLTINADGSYAFTPAQNYFGAVPTITYVVTDGLGSDVTSTLNITVTGKTIPLPTPAKPFRSRKTAPATPVTCSLARPVLMALYQSSRPVLVPLASSWAKPLTSPVLAKSSVR